MGSGSTAARSSVSRRAFGRANYVRDDTPLGLDDASEPVPDVVVLGGRPRDYRDAHPSTPLLVVEVSESSLAEDRLWKGGLYARAGVADYWIVNLRDRVLEVHREPIADAAAPHGWRYASLTTPSPGETVSPLAAPGARIPVADLLP